MGKLFVSEKGITKKQLTEVMKYHLSSFNDEAVKINNATIHNEVLSEDDGLTAQTGSKNLYKGIMQWTLSANGHPNTKWPAKWMELSVDQLATQLL